MGVLTKSTNQMQKRKDEPGNGLDEIIDGLRKMFKEKHGREPTEEEVKIWISQIKEASVTVEKK